MKQEVLADRLGISQAFVSRLENGQAIPRDDLAERIRSLVTDPAGRNVLDYVIDVVRMSPHVLCIIRPDGDNVRYVAISRGFRDHPQFQIVEEGLPVRSEASDEGSALVSTILQSGAFSGTIESIDVMWRAEIDGFCNHWHSINTPIKGNDGNWYLHCAMTQMSAGDYADRLQKRGTPIIITPYH